MNEHNRYAEATAKTSVISSNRSLLGSNSLGHELMDAVPPGSELQPDALLAYRGGLNERPAAAAEFHGDRNRPPLIRVGEGFISCSMPARPRRGRRSSASAGTLPDQIWPGVLPTRTRIRSATAPSLQSPSHSRHRHKSAWHVIYFVTPHCRPPSPITIRLQSGPRHRRQALAGSRKSAVANC